MLFGQVMRSLNTRVNVTYTGYVTVSHYYTSGQISIERSLILGLLPVVE